MVRAGTLAERRSLSKATRLRSVVDLTLDAASKRPDVRYPSVIERTRGVVRDRRGQRVFIDTPTAAMARTVTGMRYGALGRPR